MDTELRYEAHYHFSSDVTVFDTRNTNNLIYLHSSNPNLGLPPIKSLLADKDLKNNSNFMTSGH